MNEVYDKLATTFWSNDSTANEIDHAIEALRLIAPLSENAIATKSYRLFHAIMQDRISPACSEERKWEASRLALHGAYKWDKVLPWVENPKDILIFLNHHFDLATQGENQDEPIQYALRALAYASGPETMDSLKKFDPTQPSFVQGICFAFQDGRPPQLRKAALFFLPLIADRWFNTPHPIMGSDQMKSLCKDWASAIDEIGPKAYHVQKVALTAFFDMINSPHWRPHIVPDKWRLLEHFTSAPDGCLPLKRCLDNEELIGAISKVENNHAVVLWLAILWLKYKELSPEVRSQLKTATKDAQKWDFDRYLSLIETELGTAEHALTGFTTWSIDPTATALKMKIDSLREAKDSLLALRIAGKG
jgi:hypothetical protein